MMSVRRETAIATCWLVLGWLFYLTVRGWDPLGVFEGGVFSARALTAAVAGSWLWGSFPSFVHAAFVVTLLRAASPIRSSCWALWGTVTLGFEGLQFAAPETGTFCLLDLAAILLGGWAGHAVLGSGAPKVVHPSRKPVVAVLAGLTSLATSGPDTPIAPTHSPVCMSTDEFRAAFAVEGPRPLANSGRILKHGVLLLVSEPFEGIHVFDNSDPAGPVPKAFLRIPGNTDMVAKGAHLYADSAIDLLTIELKDDGSELVDRIEGFLPPRTPYELSDKSFFVLPTELDDCRDSGGVVVGFQPFKPGSGFKKRIERNREEN